MISSESLEEFKQIIWEEYGIKLTDQDAYQDAVAFLEAFKILMIDTQRKGHGNVSSSAC